MIRQAISTRLAAAGFFLGWALVAAAPAHALTSFYVEGGNPACSDVGTGTEAQPYCSISAAVAARKGAGIEILVKPGTYREQVTIPGSGVAGDPYIIRALSGPVVIDGADSYSSTGAWTLAIGDVWLAAAVTVAPDQVFMNGARLIRSTSSPATLPAGSFRHVAGQGLYVNAGGGNPGSHTLLAGRRAYGIRVDKRSWVRIEGFTVVRHEDRGIYLTGPLANTEIKNNIASLSDRNGIAAVNCSLLVISGNVSADHADHGIYLESVAKSTIEKNESSGNVRPVTPVANGLYLLNSRENLIQRNRLHHNQDSGLHFQTCASQTSLQNLLYANGDRGADHITTTGTVHVGDVSYGNAKDGFAAQTGSTGTGFYDCIAADNGLASASFDLFVDASSISGLDSDYNVFWNSTAAAPIKHGTTTYLTIEEFTAATAKDAHSAQADPRFANAAAGDFTLLDGSSAIDAATSSAPGWPATDFLGHARFDDPLIANSGAGSPAYADRGAYEWVRNVAPVAVLDAAPRSGIPPFTVTANASGSTDSDGSIASYRFDFGDGAVVGPQASPTAVHSYATGEFTLTLIVTDNQGAADTAAVAISAAPNLSTNPSFEVNLTRWNAVVGTLARVPGGFDGDFSAQLTGTTLIKSFGLNDSPNIVSPVAGPGTRYRFSAYVRSDASQGTARLQVREYLGTVLKGSLYSAPVTLSPSWQPVAVDFVATQVGSTLDFQVLDFPVVANEVFQTDAIMVRAGTVDSPPNIAAPDTLTVLETQPLSFAISVADPDSEAITSFTANLAGLPAGSNAQFLLGAGNRNATFTWTPTAAHSGLYPVTFVAANSLNDTARTMIRVLNADGRPHVTAPALVSLTEGTTATIVVTAADPDLDPITSLVAIVSGLPPGNAPTFVAAANQTSGTLTWTPSFADSGIWQVRFVAGNALADTAVTTVHVANTDRAPDVTSAGGGDVAEGNPIVVSVEVFDPEDDAVTALTVDLSALPAGHNASFTVAPNQESGAFTWTPTFADSGTYTVAFIAHNALADTQRVVIHVTNVDRAPVATVVPHTADVSEDQPLSMTVTASDPDGDAIASLTADLAGLPAAHGATFTLGAGNSSGTLNWTPGFTHAGAYPLLFTATNTLTDSASAFVTVLDVNRPPVVTGPVSITAAETDTIQIQVAASDPDGEPVTALTADLSGLPAGHGALFTTSPDHASGTLTWAPGYAAAPGPYAVTFTATNSLTASLGTSVGVTNVDRGPILSAPAQTTVAENAPLSITIAASDLDGEALTLAADLSALPVGHNASFTKSLDETSGTLTWTPSYADSGAYTVPFGATNALTASSSTLIHVSNVDRAPIVTAVAAASANETEMLTLAVSAADPDGDAIASLSADLVGLPLGGSALFATGASNTSGTLTWTPTGSDGRATPYPATFTADNALSGSATTEITVHQPPSVIAPDTVVALEGSPLTVDVAVIHPDGEAILQLSADLAGLPAVNNAAFAVSGDHTVGTMTWTPTFDDAGLYAVHFLGSSGLQESVTTMLRVQNLDRTPQVNAPILVPGSQGVALNVLVTASDPDGEAISALTANLAGIPAGNDAVFTTNGSQTAGTLTWTPTLSDGPGPYDVIFVAANSISNEATTQIQVDRRPVLTVPTTASVLENGLLTVLVSASDPDGQAITSLLADLSALPAGNDASFTTNATHTAGTLTWTPAYSDSGDRSVSFTASNALSTTASTTVTVTNVDRAPVVTSPATFPGIEGQLIEFTVTAADADGDAIATLAHDFTALPAGHTAVFTPSLDQTSGTFAWTPTAADGPGPYAVVFTASNALNGTSTSQVSVDRYPVVAAPATASVLENGLLTVLVSASDPDGQAITSLTANLSSLPAGHNASFTANATHTAGTLTWTPTYNDSGVRNVSFTASNALSTTASTLVTVTNLDRAPVVTSPATFPGTEGQLIQFSVTAADADGDSIATLAHDFSALPVGHTAVFTAALDQTSGTFAWTPTAADGPGPYAVVFTASNALSGTSTTQVSADRFPVVTAPASVSVDEDQLLTVSVTASDLDGQAITSLTADLSTLPAGNNASFTANATHTAGTLTWTPTYANAPGPYSVSFTAANTLSRSQTTSVSVPNVDRAPIVTVAPTALVGQEALLSVVVTASDPDGETITTLTPGLGALPLGNNASFTADASHTSGTFTWTPTVADGRALPYDVSFTAANALSGAGTVAIQVDRRPEVSAAPSATAIENAPFSLVVTAADLDAETITALSANLTGLPAGNDAVFTANASHTSGTLTWTPSFSAAPGPYAVTFTAANGFSGSAATSISVTNVDRAPVVVAAANANATENAPFTLVVTASDADGESITTLSANTTGLPLGNNASFTTDGARTSGTLSWTPTFSDAGPSAVSFTASNALSHTASTTVAVANVDRAPVVTAPATAPALEGVPMSVTVSAADPDGQAITNLTADLTALPLGNNASFTPAAGNASGTLTWTPTAADGRALPYAIVFRASNGIEGTATTAISVDQPPVVTAPATALIAENSVLSLRVNVSDPDGEAITSLTPDLTGLPLGHNAAFIPDAGNTGGTLTWRPTFDDGRAAPYVVRFTATSTVSTTSTTAITVDQRPEITVAASATVGEGAPLSLVVTASDPDGAPISILSANLSSLPAGHNAVFTPHASNSSGTLSWTPSFDSSRPSPYVVTFFASNTLSGGAFSLVTVTNTDRAPVVSGPAAFIAAEGQPMTMVITASDPDGNAISALTSNLAALPAGHNAVFTQNAGRTSGTLTWTPAAAQGGQTFPVAFTASNALSGSLLTPITVDRYPLVSAAATVSGPEGGPLTVTVTASDPDGQAITALTANLSGLPAGHNAVFVPGAGNTSGTLTWTPSFNDAGGPYSVGFTAANALSQSTSTAMTITNLDRAPLMTAAPTAIAPEGGAFTLVVTAADPDGQAVSTLTANLVGLPVGNNASFTTNASFTSGTLTWTPTFDDAGGPFAVAFTAANVLSGSAITAITVSSTDRVPAVTAPAATGGAEATTITVLVSAVDPDGETITDLAADFSSLPLGHGATFAPGAGNASGTFTWTPGYADARVAPYPVTFSASNAGTGSATTALAVVNVDRAPVVTVPASVAAAEGVPLNLTIAVADPDGETITAFTSDLSGLPPGQAATFTANASKTAGTLSWTPAYDVAGGPFTVTFTAANALTGFATSAITVANTDRAPVVTAPVSQSASEAQALVFTIAASDPEDEPITTLSANLAGLPAGNNAVFTPSLDRSSGTLTWTPTFSDSRLAPYAVSFTATNALSGSVTTDVTVIETNQPPTAALSLSPTTGFAPLSVNADASASFDVDGSVASYLFNFGDGTALVGPQASPLASHIYAAGLRNAKVIVTDDDGGLDSATVFVHSYLDFVTNPSFEQGFSGWTAVAAGTVIELTGNAHTGETAARATGASTLKFGFNDSPNAVTTVTAGQTYRVEAWVKSDAGTGSGQINLREFQGATLRGTLLTTALPLTPAWQMISGDYTAQVTGSTLDLQVLCVPNAIGDVFETDDITIHIVPSQAPVVVAPATATVAEGAVLTVTATATDPDGEPITSLAANLSGLPLGHNAVFASNGVNTAATLTWTPTSLDARVAPYNVIFTAANGQSGADTVAITVTNVNVPPVVTSPASITAPEGQTVSIVVTASDQDLDPITSLLALLGELPVAHGAVFTPGAGNLAGTLTWTPSFTSAGGPYVVGFRAANAAADTAFTSITITNVDRAPVVVSPVTFGAVENQLASITVAASDPDGQPLTGLFAEFSSLPSGNDAVFTANPSFTGGTLTWTPIAANLVGPYAVHFAASNSASGFDTTLVYLDHHPAMTAPATVNGAEGAPLTVVVSISDPDGHAITSLTANLASLPAGHNATFTTSPDRTSGTLSWTPTYADAGDLTVSFTGGNALTASRNVVLHVIPSDAPPAVTAPLTASGPENSTITVVVSAADLDGQVIATLLADFSGLPPGHGASFTSNAAHTSGTLTWTPSYDAARVAPYVVNFTAANAISGSKSTAITVTNVDRAPALSAPAATTAPEGSKFTLTVPAQDPDGQLVTAFTADLSGLPPGHNATFTVSPDKGIGLLSWTPTFIDAVGPYLVHFTATNDLSQTITTAISVSNTDRPPVVTAPPAAGGPELQPIVVNLTVADPDGAAIFILEANLSELPPGHNGVFTPSADRRAGTLSWTPQAGDSARGPFNVTFTATNASVGTAVTTIVVGTQDIAPVVSSPSAVAIDENQVVSFTVLAGDPNGQPITSLTANFGGLPLGHNAIFTSNASNTSGTFSWRPTFNDARIAPYSVTFTAANGKSGSVSAGVMVSDIDRAPIVTAPVSASIAATNAITVTVNAQDLDGDAFTLSADVSGLPGTASFTPGPGHTSGTLVWTPSALAVRAQPYAVHFIAANGLVGEATTAITVLAPNGPPLVTVPATATIGEGGLLTLNVTALDPEAETITSLVANFAGLPAGHNAVFTSNASRTAGTFTWTPAFTHAGGPYTVSFTAGNAGSGSASTAITVTNTDRAPAVTAPATASGIENSVVTVVVTAADADGQSIASLTADLSGLPAGHNAVFSSNAAHTSGTLTWTPIPANVRVAPYPVAFTATNALSGTGTTAITALPNNVVPDAVLQVTPSSGVAPMSVTASATGSTDANGTIASYTFDFGDGTVVGPQAAATATHDYASGVWTARLIVEDNQGARDTAQVTVNATLTNLVTNFGFETNTTGWTTSGTVTLSRVAGGHSSGFAMQLRGGTSTTAQFGNRITPNVVATHAGVGRRYRFGGWVRSVAHHGAAALEVREFTGTTQIGATVRSNVATLSTAWQYLTVDFVPTTAGTSLDLRLIDTPAVQANETLLFDDASVALLPLGDQAPLVTATPSSIDVIRNHPVTVNVTAVDPNGDAITSFTANLSGLPAGHNAVFTANAGNTAGTLTWTPAPADIRPAPYSVTFTAQNALTGTATSTFTVVDSAANLVTNPGFETDLTGWATYGAAALTRVAGGHSGDFCIQAAASSVTSFGIDDLPNVVPAGVAGRSFRFTAWIRSANSTHGVKLRIYEMNGASQVGPTIYSPQVLLTTNWQKVTVDFTTTTAGTALSLRITDYPTVASETFQIDDVSIHAILAGPALMAASHDDSDAGASAPVIAVSSPRAFAADGARALDDAATGSWTLQVEGAEGVDFEGHFPSVRLRAGERTLAAAGVTVGEDRDGNGFEEIGVRFDVEALRTLIASAPAGDGPVTLEVEIDAETPRFRSVPVTIDRVEPQLVFAATFGPNPMRVRGVLRFALTRPGAVKAELFDASGRRVRLLMDEASAKPGRFELTLDGRGDHGQGLAAGMYFFRIEAAEGRLGGRIAIVR